MNTSQHVEIEPYIGPHDQVLTRILEAQASGRVLRTHPLQQLDNGHVLVVTELRPAPPEQPVPDAPGWRGRFADWPMYYLAALAIPGLACLAVVLWLFAVGLQAVVLWGMAHALAIGTGVVVTFVCVLVFLGALARARHGYSGHRGGGYRR